MLATILQDLERPYKRSCPKWPFYGLWRLTKGFPCGSASKESTCNAGDLGSIPGLGRSPGNGNGNPLQYSCLENPRDREAWQSTVHGVAKSRTRPSNFTSLKVTQLVRGRARAKTRDYLLPGLDGKHRSVTSEFHNNIHIYVFNSSPFSFTFPTIQFQTVLLMMQYSNLLVNRSLCYSWQTWQPSWYFPLTKNSIPTLKDRFQFEIYERSRASQT